MLEGDHLDGGLTECGCAQCGTGVTAREVEEHAKYQ